MKGLKVDMVSCVLLIVVLVLVIVCCAKQTKEDFGSLTLPQLVLVAKEICPGVKWNSKKNQVKNTNKWKRYYIYCLARWLGDVSRHGENKAQQMGKCLSNGGVNMKGYFPNKDGKTFSTKLGLNNIRIEQKNYDGISNTVIATDSLPSKNQRSTINCLENLIPK